VSHPRKQIRAAVVQTLLDAGLVGGRVFRSRARELQPNELPAILVYADEETAEPTSETGARCYVKDLKVRVKMVAAGDTADEDLDDLAELVEDALALDETLGGVATSVVYASMDQGMDEETQRSHVAETLTFDVRYPDQHPRTPVVPEDLNTVAGGIDTTADGAPEIEFQETVQTP